MLNNCYVLYLGSILRPGIFVKLIKGKLMYTYSTNFGYAAIW